MHVVQQLACEEPSNSLQPSPFSVASIVGKARTLTADRESVQMQVPPIDLLTRLQVPRGTEPPVYRNKQLGARATLLQPQPQPQEWTA